MEWPPQNTGLFELKMPCCACAMNYPIPLGPPSFTDSTFAVPTDACPRLSNCLVYEVNTAPNTFDSWAIASGNITGYQRSSVSSLWDFLVPIIPTTTTLNVDCAFVSDGMPFVLGQYHLYDTSFNQIDSTVPFMSPGASNPHVFTGLTPGVTIALRVSGMGAVPIISAWIQLTQLNDGTTGMKASDFLITATSGSAKCSDVC